MYNRHFTNGQTDMLNHVSDASFWLLLSFWENAYTPHSSVMDIKTKFAITRVFIEIN